MLLTAAVPLHYSHFSFDFFFLIFSGSSQTTGSFVYSKLSNINGMFIINSMARKDLKY